MFISKPFPPSSIERLEGIPERALPLLRAIATRADIRAAMLAAGYTQAEQDEGWRLVLAGTGYTSSGPGRDDDAEARAAAAELDAVDEPLLRRARAALRRHHPAQAEFVFAGLEPGRGAAATLAVARFLERTSALEHGTERAAAREQDHAALATLERRGIGKAERERLAALVAKAHAVAEIVDQAALSDGEQRRQQALIELERWYADWSETARAVVRRRDQLILMGLAHRRARAEEEESEPEPVALTAAAQPAGAASPTVAAVPVAGVVTAPQA